ncbi:inositol polyphosphate phosphatase [Mycena amicta]|nr:inositol polyphosphate phosphatase [Mycena amicta]
MPRLLVQLASYNTNLQGDEGVPQNLVDWLSPTLQVSDFLSNPQHPADIIAVGFQELLPLHLGREFKAFVSCKKLSTPVVSGLSKKVIENRNAHIIEEIETFTKERYGLVQEVVNGGVALLVYARDAGIARSVCDVQTAWTGTGPAYMANKGAVAVRFRLPAEDGGPGETFTFVCAHLTAHAEKLANRIADWHHIVGTLLFPGTLAIDTPSTIYHTSHLFCFGDLNFRVVLPPEHPLKGAPSAIGQALSHQSARDVFKEYDQLLTSRRRPSNQLFVGLHEGEFWKFKPSYKYHIGQVDRYSEKRSPAWTDRILYATYSDSPDTPDKTAITNLLYTSVPGYTTSDHKPIVSLLLLPETATSTSTTPPILRLPLDYAPTPDPRANLKRYTGRVIDRLVGRIWWALTLLGAGSAVVGLFNFILGLSAWGWWRVKTAGDGAV